MTATSQSDALRRVLARSGHAPEPLLREFLALFRKKRVAKRALWLAAGERAEDLGFVVKGLFRLYYTRSDGKEFNKSFVAEDDFLASVHSLLDRVPSRLSIQALADSEILVAPYAAVASFYERDMFFQRLGRLVAERLVVKKLEREASLLMDGANVRYEAFRREYAKLEPRLADHHVARYLGITPEALSRLKRAQ
jgi:CRP-like cAMP-binding protein